MKKCVIYGDVRAFYGDTHEILLQDEVKNIIMLGNMLIGVDGRDRTGWRDSANWFMAAVKDGGRIVLTVLMTPPMNLTLYETGNIQDDGALDTLIGGIPADIPVPGVMAEKSLALRFADMYKNARGIGWSVTRDQRIYALTDVAEAYLSGGYTLRPAADSDMSFLPYWIHGFNTDCHMQTGALEDSAQTAMRHINRGSLYILEDGKTAVSMAGNNRNMVTAGGVGPVYTPPYFRNRGYAGACVARLSRRILNGGKKCCVLYTDLANPVSNSLYQKIGYRAVCDSAVISFSENP